MEKINPLEIRIGKLKLQNPVLLASGTCGYGSEIADFTDVKKLGGVVTKTITLKPRTGNPVPRIVETPSGMLNSIGLENKGLEDFAAVKSRELSKLGTEVIASIAGDNIKEFSAMAERLSLLTCVSGIEVNLSCPNVLHGMASRTYKLIAQDARATSDVVKAVRKCTKKTLIVKLSPNVTDIKEIAKAAENAGADAVSAINTLFGLSVNIKTGKPNLARGAGGLSGPAVKPVALYHIKEIYSCVKIPIIGMGGIMSFEDVIEFMMCGAACVQIGTCNFIHPGESAEIVRNLEEFVKGRKIKNISSLIGSVKI